MAAHLASAPPPPPPPPPLPPAPAQERAAALLPRINVVGSGDVSKLALPDALAGAVHIYSGLGYEEYFDTMCRSIALLPLFNEASGYLRDKISSSVLASLATGAPLLVPRAFLDVYSFLTPDHVLLMAPGESELQSMLRLLRSGGLPETLAAQRGALARLRFVLNHQAASKLDGLVQAAVGKPRSPGKHPPDQGKTGGPARG
ncbi:MAG: hypothetical protein J3K34DRAFT_402192 [Monoraphidium minutum]|nr:MAG: hypothetical protein J3K34DRAFT_402192 [Monoraphidium minutum]